MTFNSYSHAFPPTHPATRPRILLLVGFLISFLTACFDPPPPTTPPTVGRATPPSAQVEPSPSPLTRPADSFRVVSYNVRNWLIMDRRDGQTLQPQTHKPPKERQAVLAILARLEPDIIALQELGDHARYLEEFRSELAKAGLQLSYSFSPENGFAGRIRNGILSRYPILRAQSLHSDRFQLQGQTLGVSRAIALAEIDLPGPHSLTILVTHLKSRRPLPKEEPDQAAIRQAEAQILRQHMNQILKQNPQTLLLVAGDLNDTPNSSTLRILTRRRDNIQFHPLTLTDPQGDHWTHFFAREQSYQRIDYFIVSESLLPYFIPTASQVYRELPNSPPEHHWANASDHRPIIATFQIP